VRLLLVEDEIPLATPLARGLREEGYATDVAGDGRAAAVLVEATDYDLIVLDLGLPDGPGLELLRRWRADGVACPVLVLTAHDSLEDKVRGLDGGADDYLTKPFAFAELVARIRSLLRRREAPPVAVVEFADVVLDRTRRRVERAGEPLELTPKEFALLEFFMLHPGVVLDRNAIAEHVWDYRYEARTNVIDVIVGRLRRKLEGAARPRLVHTVTGVGYVLRAAEER
jgi:DNA-binding response OmpR family regulator